ncbi:alpha/beta fold hydrolase [Sphingomonas aestuarii]
MIRRQMLSLVAAVSAAALMPGVASAQAFASDRISVTTTGQGRDVILIPGLSSSPRVWKEMIAAVPGYRYHLVQVAGFAGAPAGGNATGDTVAAPVAEEIARYIAVNKLKAPAVIGHSMGGTMGMMVAARHPASVSKLMVVDMFPFIGAMFGGPNATAESVKPMADNIFAQMTKADEATRKAQRDATIAGMINTESMRAGALEDSAKSDTDVSARAYRELVVTDLRPELSRITAPTTVLYVTPKGVPLSDAQMDGYYQASYATLKGATLTRIPDAAHFIMWDQPVRFQQEVKAFLAK